MREGVREGSEEKWLHGSREEVRRGVRRSEGGGEGREDCTFPKLAILTGCSSSLVQLR